MVENSHQMNSKSYAKTQKERTELSWKLEEICFMIKIFPCIYGQKLPEQWCMYRTVLHIEYSRTRLLNKSSPARNQKSAISKYSAVLCKREENKIRSFRK